MQQHHEAFRHLAQTVGLNVRERDADAFSRWIAQRVHKLALPGIEQYSSLLDDGSATGRRERELLSVQFTTGESYFLRDQDQLELIATTLLPQRMESRAKERKLRLWSAGCATGEEAYSLAMLVYELAPRLAGWQVLILGADINSAALDSARQGVYSDWSFRTLDSARKQRYFRPSGRHWQVNPQLRQMVSFRSIDLVRDRFPDAMSGLGDFDLILCRNVFIYLDAQAVGQILAKFAGALTDGGYLVPDRKPSSPNGGVAFC